MNREQQIERQKDLELEAYDLGAQQYRKERSTRLRSENGPELKFIEQGIKGCINPYNDIMSRATYGSPMRGCRIWYPILIRLKAEVVIATTLITMFNEVDYNSSVYSLCMRVGESVRNELRLLRIKEEFFDEYNEYKYKSKGHFRPILVAKLCRELGIEETWDRETKVHVGAMLVKVVLENTQYFKYLKYKRGKETITRIIFTEEFIAELEQIHDALMINNPWNFPMIAEPLPWDYTETGGYYFIRNDMVKRPHWDTKLSNTKPKTNEVYVFLNLLQNTAWKINTMILSVAKQIWEAGGGMAGIPSKELISIPPFPKEGETDLVVKKEWKKVAAGIHDLNAAQMSKRKATIMKIFTANKFVDEEAIYYVWQLDWRGRAYPIGSHLNPQGDDLSKALLMFAKGQPLGPDGLKWLTIHLANCIGWDKIPFDQRISQVYEWEQTIRGWVKDPMGNRSWMDADDPFMTLASAVEWVAAIDSGQPEAFCSHIPVSMDGSCNGLQHFSAIGRDLVGGDSVNLVPSDCPQDIYTEVANAGNDLISEDCKRLSADHICHTCEGKLTRKLTKRGVMTTPYGVTPHGMQNQLFEDDMLFSVSGNKMEHWKIAQYLRDIIYQAVGQVVIAAREYMNWLKDIAAITSKAGIEVEWFNPVGFKVIQAYRKREEKDIKTSLQRITLYRQDKGPISVHKQSMGLPPNFIHSLDASHLTKCVCRMGDLGIDSFMMVHDSYGVHASYVSQMHDIIRDEFVKLHEQNPIEELKRQVEETLKTPLPDLPIKGELNLARVYDSEYFFH